MTATVRSAVCAAIWMVAALVQTSAHGVVPPQEFASDEHAQRYARLLNELRCLVCQNQTLADSNAGLAVDMRAVISDMVRDNASDEQIIQFMVDRYGNFVRYRPPLNAQTALLWGGPFVLVVIALGFVAQLVRRQQRVVLSEQQQRAAQQLLDK